MKYFSLAALLLLLSCSTPQETSVNGGLGVLWGAPNEGTQFVYSVLMTQDTSQTEKSDSIMLLSSNLDGTRRIERFDPGLQLFSQYPTIFQLDPNGTITLAGTSSSDSSADTLRYMVGGLPFTTRTSTVDSIANGDTITLVHVIRYYGRDLPNVPQATGPVPHILDSTYMIERGTATFERIWAYNLWFVPELGGVYAKYIEDYESVQPGSDYHYVEERNLVRYSK